jgi:hypothetical protein
MDVDPNPKGRHGMSNPVVTVGGAVKPDGSLELDERLTLPVGRVQVTIVPLPELPRDDPFWQMMQGIWESRRQARLQPRSVEEVEAERRAVREEWEERMRRLDVIREEARRLRGEEP